MKPLPEFVDLLLGGRLFHEFIIPLLLMLWNTRFGMYAQKVRGYGTSLHQMLC